MNNLFNEMRRIFSRNSLHSAGVYTLVPLLFLIGCNQKDETSDLNAVNSETSASSTESLDSQTGEPIPPGSLAMNTAASSLPSFSATTKVQAQNGIISDRCFNILGKNGTPGPWGKTILTEMNKYGNTFYSTSGGMREWEKVCPSFARLNPAQKQNLWLWMWSGLSQLESTCNPAYDKSLAANGVLGLFQLENDAKKRKGRGPECADKNMRDVNNNIACAVRIMNSHITGKQEGSPFPQGTILTNSTYWEPIKNNNIEKWVRKNKNCK